MLSSRDDADSQTIDPSLVSALVSQANILLSWQVATVVLLVYDAVITLDKEVEFFWGASFTKPVTIVYFLNRYTGILGAIARIFSFLYNQSVETCNFAVWAVGITNWITIVSIDYILLVRVLALYSKNKKLSFCLTFLLILEAVSQFAFVVVIDVVQGVIAVPIASDTTVCFGKVLPPLNVIIVDWTVPMAYGLLLMVLALYQAAEYWKMAAGFKGFKLVRVLIEDQAVYFMAAVMCCVFNIMNTKVYVSNAALASILQQAGSPSFLCILGSRMLFNLKEAGKQGVNEGTSYRFKSVTEEVGEMEFIRTEVDGTRSEESNMA